MYKLQVHENAQKLSEDIHQNKPLLDKSYISTTAQNIS